MITFIKWLLIIALIIITIVILRKFKHPRLNTINLFSGGNGSGKTSIMICYTKMMLRRFYFLFKNFGIKHKYIILSSFPVGSYVGRGKRRHYVNYIKVFGRKFNCYNLTLDVFTMLKKLPQDEVIIIADEFNKIASQFDFNNPVVNKNINEFASMLRHYTHGKGYLLAADQSLSNICLQVRRRCNFAYNMVSCKKLLLLPITIYEYRKILISDDVQNVVMVKDSTQENEICKFIFFTNPFKNYDSYAYADRYQIIDEYIILTPSISFKRNDLLMLTYSKPLYYKCLQYDGFDEIHYYASFKK